MRQDVVSVAASAHAATRRKILIVENFIRLGAACRVEASRAFNRSL
jgi:hypothetical protein